MKMKRIGYVLVAIAVSFAVNLNATNNPDEAKRSGKRGNNDGTASNCTPPTGALDLDIGNTRALIQTGGDMWWNLAGRPRYEIPKGSGRHSMFAASLWLGGQDVSGQLKVAAQRFRSLGNDFWTGPLSTTTAEIDAETCLEYDRHWLTTMNDVAEFVAWHQLGQEDPEAQAEQYPNYQIPQSITEWPAHGRDFAPYNEDFNLAPFVDTDGDGIYNPQAGDYPRYNLDGVVDCQQRIVDIYGDQNLWWIFNDKGNIHTESNGDPIGMEVRAQAFAYATNDEVNNMTFYNYELVNRSSFELTNTYFGFWVDSDLGDPFDDYVGCDPSRGFGFSYNGNETDQDNAGALGYGTQPPAIGVDFFQGPFQDNDGKDNCLCQLDCQGARNDDGIPYDGLGVGYGDGIPDNERLGMRAFLYHDNNASVTGDPTEATEYYNYLRGFWRDNSRMIYGGNGHQNSNTPPYIPADYMFPGTNDPIGWGTDCDPQPNWTEVTAGNTAFDRRFIQSAGPFRLSPGAVNNITVGVVWSRANSGGVQGSLNKLMIDNDKTQAMFDNCFDLLDGPDAPLLEVVELDREIILKIVNPQVSNNFNEAYVEEDPFLVAPDTLAADGDTVSRNSNDPDELRRYRELEQAYSAYTFEGYQIFQLKDNSVSGADLFNEDLARLVAQCDIKNDIEDLINYPFSEDLNAAVPEPRVEDAENDGIKQSFRITQDLFATGDRRLVNHKTYYFMAIAYAHNEYAPYSQTPDGLEGQTMTYLPSRKGPTGPIPINRAVPNKPDPRNSGTVLNAQYGDGIAVKRIEGVGNSGRFVEIKQEDIDAAFEEKPFLIENPTYEEGAAPLEIKVVDPLNVVDGTFTVFFKNIEKESDLLNEHGVEDASMFIVGEFNEAGLNDTIVLEKPIGVKGERYVPQLGISIEVGDVESPGMVAPDELPNNGVIGSELVFEDITKPWLTGVANADGNRFRNWIRSGSNAEEDLPEYWDYELRRDGRLQGSSIDPDEHFEQLLGGTWAPFRLGAWNTHGPGATLTGDRLEFRNIYQIQFPSDIQRFDDNPEYALQFLHDVDIVFTSDKSKWTRCVVLETQDDSSRSIGSARKLFPRQSPSVDKAGNPATGGPSDNEEDPGYISAFGMGWFPGYAIDVQTGERLNMAFGEDSYLTSDNGNDMLWNPTSRISEGISEDAGIRFGGKHYVYVFRNNIVEEGLYGGPDDYNNPEGRMPAYDEGRFIIEKLGKAAPTTSDFRNVYRACNWVGLPLLEEGRELLETEARVKLRVNRKFDKYASGERLSVGSELEEGVEYLVQSGPVKYSIPDGEGGFESATFNRGDIITGLGEGAGFVVTAGDNNDDDVIDNLVKTQNGGRPMYEFTLDGLAPTLSDQETAEDALDLIHVVPNPYYAYSSYEVDKTDNRVKIINLPERCDIKIYSVNGVLVREFKKDDPVMTSIDWDLQNHARIPISSGLYLIHVNVPGVGEKVLKWYGVMRPVDLDNF